MQLNSKALFFNPQSLASLVVVTGHYGVGKTNFSLNLALSYAEAGEEVTLVDLDIVNPYFRSSDHVSWLEEQGISLIAPTFAGTTVEAPVLPPDIYSAFNRGGRVIFDLGGDDAGALALGAYADQFKGRDYDFLYLINENRNLTQDAASALEVLYEIEAACKLKATGLILNTHLQKETTCEMIAASAAFAKGISESSGLELKAATIPYACSSEPSCLKTLTQVYDALYPVKTLVLPPWE